EKKYVEEKGSSYGSPQGGVMCTGPYELKKWAAGSEIDLTRNDSWWNAANRKQWPKTATFTFVTETETSTSALTSGEIDGEFEVPAAALSALQTSQAGRLLTGPSTQVLALAPLHVDGTIGNVKIRQAVEKLIDYNGYAGSQYANTAVPARALAGPNSWVGGEAVYKAAYEKLPPAEQDLKQAEALVKQSGISNPTVKVATYNGLPQEAALMSQIQASAESIGLELTFDSLPLAEFTTLFTSQAQRDKYDLMMQYSGGEVPEAFQFYQSVARPGGVNNLSGWSDPAVTKLLDQAQGEKDPAKRAELTVQAQQTITEQAVWIPIVFPNFSAFVNKELAGVPTSFPSVAYWPWLPDVGGR
ncbi:MAG: ABC transporter substrate-binding protein, partial [Actinobacteria bacterium]|nr:ABC transporter substrate-binding protein [Actinomycetota bacterium]